MSYIVASFEEYAENKLKNLYFTEGMITEWPLVIDEY